MDPQRGQATFSESAREVEMRIELKSYKVKKLKRIAEFVRKLVVRGRHGDAIHQV
jgi:hypothetical protein